MIALQISTFIYKFLLVLSIVYLFKFILGLTLRLFQENPEPMETQKVEQLFILLSVSYIITYFLT
jgi:hypothetical protein